jgi:elongation factor P
MAKATELRKGKVINHNGTPHQVLDMQHRTQGRGQGWVQATLRNLENRASSVVKFGSTDSIDVLMTENQRYEFSYEDGAHYVFMDPATFESIEVSGDIVTDQVKKFLVPNKEYDFLIIEGKPVEIVLPASVDLKVVESPEGVRGDTATNVQKPATTETGLIVQVPLFIKEGEVIKVSTADGSYMGRA